ncbi:MAG: 3D domain-containing protein [Planctomycetota bacterium]
MQKTTVTGVYGSSSPRVVLSILLYIAVFCVLSCIIVISYAKPNGRLALLSTTITEAEAAGGTANNLFGNRKWQTVQMYITAYCPCKKCCDEYSNGKTACGHKIRPGDTFVAADKNYPFGTEMIIADYNNGEPVKVLDRGGAIRGNRLDVFFNSHKEALKWGVRYLDVKVHQK